MAVEWRRRQSPEAVAGPVFEMTVDNVAHGGYVVGRHLGQVVFVRGALPGERIRVQVTGRRSRLLYGQTVEVLDPSVDRVEHPWPTAVQQDVGGMDLGHMSLSASRAWKAKVISEQMARLAHVDWQGEVQSAPGDDQRGGLGWRSRMRLRVDSQGRIGMTAARSHRFVATPSLPMADQAIGQWLAGVGGRLPPLADQTITVVHPSAGRWDEPPTDSDTAWPKDKVVVIGAGGHCDVRELVRNDFGHWQYGVAADGFWQVHAAAPALLTQAVWAALDKVDGPVWDLYAGAGLFTKVLAQYFQRPILAVEASPSGVKWLRRNTADLDVTVLGEDVTKALVQMAVKPGGLMVADPPRNGIGRMGVTAIIDHQPARIIYVACDPAALARDTNWLMAAGYRLSQLQAFDLFPLTHHVECLAQFDLTGR
ncbi:MAG: TRAM domain-containing protein [Propionibacteriaceae bacterium]|jgi:tRNA/tmRNA/rRNA uracil-C5-methylase (TrmA/RlmC/RlmD family)|nr:TRAM domain-containing protein [Propionibacteriaceae bacterium]